MNIYGRPGHREYRWMTELRDHHTRPHWESREMLTTCELSKTWGYTQWLSKETEESGIALLLEHGFAVVRVEVLANG